MLKYSYVQQLRKKAGFGQNAVNTLSAVSPAFGIVRKGVQNVVGTAKGVYNGAKNIHNGIKGGIQGFRQGFSGIPQAGQPAVSAQNGQTQNPQQQSAFSPFGAAFDLSMLGSLPSMLRNQNKASQGRPFNAEDYTNGLY